MPEKQKIDSREKGKRIERVVANALRPYFPSIARNANAQSQSSDGRDLINTPGFAFEIKGGKSVQTGTWGLIQKALAQNILAKKEAADIGVVWVRTDNVDASPNSAKIKRIQKLGRDPRLEFVVLTANDFTKLLKTHVKKNKKNTR